MKKAVVILMILICRQTPALSQPTHATELRDETTAEYNARLAKDKKNKAERDRLVKIETERDARVAAEKQKQRDAQWKKDHPPAQVAEISLPHYTSMSKSPTKSVPTKNNRQGYCYVRAAYLNKEKNCVYYYLTPVMKLSEYNSEMIKARFNRHFSNNPDPSPTIEIVGIRAKNGYLDKDIVQRQRDEEANSPPEVTDIYNSGPITYYYYGLGSEFFNW